MPDQLLILARFVLTTGTAEFLGWLFLVLATLMLLSAINSRLKGLPPGGWGRRSYGTPMSWRSSVLLIVMTYALAAVYSRRGSDQFVPNWIPHTAAGVYLVMMMTLHWLDIRREARGDAYDHH